MVATQRLSSGTATFVIAQWLRPATAVEAAQKRDAASLAPAVLIVTSVELSNSSRNAVYAAQLQQTRASAAEGTAAMRNEPNRRPHMTAMSK